MADGSDFEKVVTMVYIGAVLSVAWKGKWLDG